MECLFSMKIFFTFFIFVFVFVDQKSFCAKVDMRCVPIKDCPVLAEMAEEDLKKYKRCDLDRVIEKVAT